MQNYHRHTSYSNIMTPDSAVSNEDYAKRAVELGHKVLSSVEHGWQGYYYETFELAQKYGLKFIFGAEAYWVKDRFEKDRTNAHIILLARNEAGRREINTILSEGNITGYYYKPRIDLELLLQLNPDNVLVTSACVGFWAYEDMDQIVKTIHRHFGNSFMLEIQYHNTDKQKLINYYIQKLHEQHKIRLIVGMDSHYITPDQKEDRDYLLEGKGIKYPEEDGWYMDYPDDEETKRRFLQQGCFTEEQIDKAMKNTDILLKFDDITFTKDIKMPVPPSYKDKTKEERADIYSRLITAKLKEFLADKPKEMFDAYVNAVREEVFTYKNTGMCDYPLIDYEIIKRGIEKGGVVTSTGRGSAPGFLTNTLCGFSKIDRLASPIKLYPERFMSETRILETQSLPDIDMNLGTPEIFEEAQAEIMGEGHSYPMIAFGTLRKKAAFKMYARAKNLDFDLANNISKQIEDYETALKYADDDDKHLIDIFEYVDEKYHDYIKQSKSYWGIIDNKKRAPCAFLLYDGDIKSEIGLLKCKSETTKKEYITAVIDGAIAENYKFLKNDLLKVNTVLLTDLVYKRIGIAPHDVTQLSQEVSGNEKVWDIYANALTVGINQCERQSTKNKIVRYKPKNVSELAAFIAAIRPGFKSMYETFESRAPFSYDIKPFDDLIQTEEFPYSFILYQEQLMTALNYAGFPMGQCYQIIKDIAKKHPEKVLPLKNDFLSGFASKIRPDCETDEEAEDMAERVWQIIYDSTSYGFNSAHAYAMALDSLYGAWQKSHHPYEFYEVYLQFYSEQGEKDKVSELKYEMEKGFGIKEGDYRWGVDNRRFRADKENHQIIPSLLSLKGVSQKCADKIYSIYEKEKIDNFPDLWIALTKTSGINKSHIEKLAKINYFQEFGNIKQILTFIDHANTLYGRSQFNKNTDIELINQYKELVIPPYTTETEGLYKNFDSESALKTLWNEISEDDSDFTALEKLNYEMEIFGFIKTRINTRPEFAYVLNVNDKYKNRVVKLHRLDTGENEFVKIKGNMFEKNPVKERTVIKTTDAKKERKWKPDGEGGFYRIDELETILYKWSNVEC
ncbi:DNA polymerase III alpha subunit [Clostridiales Family XIII bacterium PM5-7]